MSNGRYAVGHLSPGQPVAEAEQFDCLDAAFNHWYDTLPASFTLNRAAA
ncbi:MAG: hypothetical protein HY850_02620 [Betaproteobacteria bacterium]|nr:hypothetical protein [Betaproteobacteria bacterium]